MICHLFNPNPYQKEISLKYVLRDKHFFGENEIQDNTCFVWPHWVSYKYVHLSQY